jgi:hypothetical protein
MKINVFILTILFISFTSCKEKISQNKKSEMKIGTAVKKAEIWLSMQGVVGVAQSKVENKDCILVMISMPVDSLKDSIPKTYQGFPVVIQNVGIIDAQKH